jgi:integrase
VDRYLDSVQAATTQAGYAETFARLSAIAGSRDAGTLQPEDYAAVTARWDGAAAATWNRHLSALASFNAWGRRNEILATNPARRLKRRKPARRGDRAIPRARLERLFTDDRHGLRERVLWRMLYETAARAEEILTLNVEDLDPEFRRARVTSKGVRPLGHRHRPPASPTAARPRLRPGVPRREARTPPPGAAPPPTRTPARPPAGVGCPTRTPSTCSSRRAHRSTRTRKAGPCTSCATCSLLCFRVAIAAIGGQADLRPALFDYLFLAAACRGTT